MIKCKNWINHWHILLGRKIDEEKERGKGSHRSNSRRKGRRKEGG